MINGHLKSRHIIVQRRRVLATLNVIDPLAAATRWSRTVARRCYRVAGPNSLWHIDGHMKLIRFVSLWLSLTGFLVCPGLVYRYTCKVCAKNFNVLTR